MVCSTNKEKSLCIYMQKYIAKRQGTGTKRECSESVVAFVAWVAQDKVEEHMHFEAFKAASGVRRRSSARCLVVFEGHPNITYPNLANKPSGPNIQSFASLV